MDGIFTLVQMTAAYSNAVLVAILPHMTDVAQKLELPFPTPITQSEVRHFFCDPRAGEVGGYVVLTNGYEFWFQHGYVNGMSSPWNVFRLQDPDLLPKFYGPLRMNEEEAAALARKTLKKLGYTNDVFDTVEPEVRLESPKESFAVNQGVPQYQVIWHDPDRANLDIAELDVNAKVKHVDAFQLYSKMFWRTNPAVGVVPKVLPHTNSAPAHVGGYRLTPVSEAYSNACMNALMPLFTDFARKLRLPLQLPLTLDQCTNIQCGTHNGQPEVQILLTNGDRFAFEHGYVLLYYAHDNYWDGGLQRYLSEEELDHVVYQAEPADTNELIRLARQAVRNLGYSEKTLNMERPPDYISILKPTKPHHFLARYEIAWNNKNIPGAFGYRVDIEVDAKTKNIKIIHLDDTNLWRAPPKIDAPPAAESAK